MTALAQADKVDSTAGKPAEGRGFRPDIQGLRAVAVTMVVIYHLYPAALPGGFAGVDVFFVISGYLITGHLWRGYARTGKVGLADFWGRRARRLVPAAVLVLTVTWIVSRIVEPATQLANTAQQILASALYVQNWQLSADAVDYLKSNDAATPVQHFWSLSVEEQFYVLYPTLFIVTALAWSRVNLRLKLTIVLTVSIVASFIWSIVQTSSNGTAAYFSPFTRAWELALGGLVAVASLQLAKLPRAAAMAMTWIGLGGILLAGFAYSATTTYPGSAVALPVISTALVVAGGTAAPRLGAEWILRLPPFRWLGKLSYSLYLWHWPILIIAAQYAGHPLSVKDNLGWVLLALAFSIVSYFVVENPLRHWKYLSRSGIRSLCLGALFIGASLGLMAFETGTHP
jgi:peptidoglycan/LPS O-acetylase OafA/YrhL